MKIMMTKLAIGITLAVFLVHEVSAVPSSSLSSKRRHTVLPFVNTSDVDGNNGSYRLMGEVFSDLITCCLSANQDIVVLDRDHIERVLSEHQLALTGELDRDRDLIRHRVSGVSVIHAGSFEVKDRHVRVIVRSFDVETSIVQDVIEEKGMINTLDQLCERLAQRISERLPVSGVVGSLYQVDISPSANVHFARGLALFWGNEYGVAVSEFLRALSLPKHRDEVHYWLGRSYFSGGHWLDARLEFYRFVKKYPSHHLVADAKLIMLECEHKLNDSGKLILADQDNFPSRPVDFRFWDERK